MKIGDLFSVLTAKIFGGAAVVLAIALTVQTVRLAWEQAHSAKVEGDLKWAKEERAHFETKIIDRTAEALTAQNALNAAIKEKSNEAARQSQASFDALQRRYLGLLRTQGSAGKGSRANPAAQGDAPGMVEGLPAATGSPEGSVCLTSENMARLSAYAVGAHDLAADLVNRGVAEFAPAP